MLNIRVILLDPLAHVCLYVVYICSDRGLWILYNSHMVSVYVRGLVGEISLDLETVRIMYNLGTLRGKLVFNFYMHST